MSDADRIKALEARQRQLESELIESRELELRCNAIRFRLLERGIEQDSFWDTLMGVARNAADSYLHLRDKGLEARLDAANRESGVPHWLSMLIAVGVMFIPVSAVTSAFLGALMFGTQTAFTDSSRRKLQMKPRLIPPSKERITNPDRYRAAVASEQQKRASLNEEIRRTEKLVGDYFQKFLQPEVAPAARAVLKTLGDQAGKVLYSVSPQGKFSVAGVSVVGVQDSVVMWVRERRREEAAIRTDELAAVENAYSIATEHFEFAPVEKGAKAIPSAEMKKKLAARDNARKAVRAMYRAYFETDELVPIKSKLPESKMLPPSEFKDLQQLIEMMMWSQTFDFRLRPTVKYREVPRFEVDKDPPHPLLRGFQTPTVSERYETLDPPALPDEMWKLLLETYDDPDTGKKFAVSEPSRTLGTLENPAPSDVMTKGLPFLLYPPKVRFSYLMSQLLAPALEQANRELTKYFRKVI
jgi:hypothetical protein